MPRSFWSPLSELQRKARLLADDLAAWKNAARAAIERSGGGPPAIVQDRLRPFCMALDGVWTPGAGSAYFSGWMWDPSNSLADLALVLPGGVEAPVKLRLTSTPRPDVDEYLAREFLEPSCGRPGFICFVVHPAIKAAPGPFRLRARFADGTDVSVSRRLTRTDPDLGVQRRLLATIAEGFDPGDAEAVDLLEQVMGNMPAQRAGQRRIRKVVRFGTAPANPAVSVVVPLFRGLRLFEAQLACLSGDRY